MRLNSINSIQSISQDDGHVTVQDIKDNVDTDRDGTISATEAEASDIAPQDLEEINQRYHDHESDPSAVIFHKSEIKALRQQRFVIDNMARLDADSDGWISEDEVAEALGSNQFNREQKAILRDLSRDIEDIEELSNDEWGDENDGITLADMQVLVQESSQLSQGQVRRVQNEAAVSLQEFVNENFERLDRDSDGWISEDELDQAVYDPSFSGNDAAHIATLKRRIEDIEELSNDEWGDENDGITRADMQAMVRMVENGDSDANNITFTAINVNNKARHVNRNLYANSANPLASIRLNNMSQGSIGDCFFLSAVQGVVNRNPQSIMDMIHDNGDDTYTVTFPGASEPVTVNAPTDAEMLTFATSGADGMWFSILEKAYAEIRNDDPNSHNPREAIDGGDFQGSAIKMLTGHTVDTDWEPTSDNDEIRQKLMRALRPDDGIERIVTASTFLDGSDEHNLMSNHVYTILDYDPNTDRVLIRNPHGQGSDARNIENEDNNNDGMYWLTIEELAEHFNLLCYEQSSPITDYDHEGSTYDLSGGF